MTYPIKTFSIPVLNGISEKQINVHLGLYEGYVKQVNLPALRFAFEFNGMRMHELYFAQLEAGSRKQEAGNALAEVEGKVREVAGMRGPGWVVVYYDPAIETLHTVFVRDHEIGQLAGLPILLVLDLWEHAYMVDYLPAEKKNYIDAFFANLNWSVVEKRFDDAKKMRPA